MGLVETEGLILKSFSLAEADKIVILLTRDEGLVRGVARGAKRLKSRFGGGLELFSIVEISYFQKEDRELVTIKQVELLKSYFGISAEPLFYENFSYLADLLLEFAQPHDPNERLYRMAKVCLEAGKKNIFAMNCVVVYFEIWMLKLGGYLPDWRKCQNCQKEIVGNEKTQLQINFHLFCQNCHKSQGNWGVSPEQRQIFIAAQQMAPDKFVEFARNRNASLKELSVVLGRIAANILGRELFRGRITKSTVAKNNAF